MNLFMPYEDISKSVQSLDDKRLNKQILECYQILQVALGKSHGYENHPVVKHYHRYRLFVVEYGVFACNEYHKRFGKEHRLSSDFTFYWTFLEDNIPVVLLYSEYPATDPRCIRETDTERVTALFRL